MVSALQRNTASLSYTGHGAILPFIIAPAGFLLGRGLGFSPYYTLRLHLFRGGGDPLHISRGRVSFRADRLLPGLEISDRILQSSCRDSRVNKAREQNGGRMASVHSESVP